MIKTEGFTSDNAESLSSMINSFLIKIEDSKVISIQYGTYGSVSGSSSLITSSPRVSALVVYKED